MNYQNRSMVLRMSRLPQRMLIAWIKNCSRLIVMGRYENQIKDRAASKEF